MKKIIFFCPTVELGGVGKNLFKVINFYANKEKNVYLVTFNGKIISKHLNKNIKLIDTTFFGSLKLPYLLKVILCIFNYLFTFGLKRKNIFISFQSNLYFILLAKITGNKIIARSNAAPNYYINSTFKKLIFKFIYNLADIIVVNSYEFKKIFFKVFNVNSKVIYNPATNFEKKINFKYKSKLNKKVNFLNVGRLTFQKNQILLLRSFNELKYLNYKLIIIGYGSDEKRLKNYIINNKLQNRIKIINNISNIVPYLKKSEVFILSSIFEGLPNVLIEAQIAKKFIISSNCPTGPKEILMNGKAGYLFKNNDYHDLKIKIKKYFIKKNTNDIKKKIKFGYDNLYRFDEKTNLLKYYKLIHKL